MAGNPYGGPYTGPSRYGDPQAPLSPGRNPPPFSPSLTAGPSRLSPTNVRPYGTAAGGRYASPGSEQYPISPGRLTPGSGQYPSPGRLRMNPTSETSPGLDAPLRQPSAPSEPSQDTVGRMSLISRQVEQMTQAVEEQQKQRAERRQQTREDLAQMRKLAEDRYKSGARAMELLAGMSPAGSLTVPPASKQPASERSPTSPGSMGGSPAKSTASSTKKEGVSPTEGTSFTSETKTAVAAARELLKQFSSEETGGPPSADPLSWAPSVAGVAAADNFTQPGAAARAAAAAAAATVAADRGIPSAQQEATAPIGSSWMQAQPEQPADTRDFGSWKKAMSSAEQPKRPVVEEKVRSPEEASPAKAKPTYEVTHVPPPKPTYEVMYVPPPTVSSEPGNTIEFVYATPDGVPAPPRKEMKAAPDPPKQEMKALDTPGPAWMPAVAEGPSGTRDIGSWTKSAYSTQQQQRLGTVDEAPAAPVQRYEMTENKRRLSNREQLYQSAASSAPAPRALEAPLLQKDKEEKKGAEDPEEPFDSCRHSVFLNIEGYTEYGRRYQFFLMMLVLVNYVCFAYDEEFWDQRGDGTRHHPLRWLTDLIENISVAIFTVDYLLRLWTCVYFYADYSPETSCVSELGLQLRWACSNFFAILDLLSIVPFWIDLFTVGDTFRDTAWIRVGRILKLLPPIDYRQVWLKSYKLLMAGGFVGFTVWIICASLYYMFERHNPDMDYDVEGSNLKNRFQSIPLAMYFSLLNFFGEYPLADNHSVRGRYVAVFIQVIGAGALAIPAGALGNAFADEINEVAEEDDAEDDGDAKGEDEVPPGAHSQLQDALDGKTGVLVPQLPFDLGDIDLGVWLPKSMYCLSVASVIYFAIDNMQVEGDLNLNTHATDTLQFFRICNGVASFLLAAEFGLRLYCASEEGYTGCYSYLWSFAGFIDWSCWLMPTFSLFAPEGWQQPLWAFTVLRIVKLDRAVGAVSIFKGIFWKTRKVFLLTGAVALVLWLYCSAIMYYCERKNPDGDMQPHYKSVTASMWLTLLNLTGEAPLCDYTTAGKWVSALMGFFGQGFVSIPMGLLGAAFQDELDPDADKEDDEKGDGDKGKENDAKEEVKELSGYEWLQQDSNTLTFRQKVFKFLAGAAANQSEDLNPWEGRAVLFEKVIFLAIGLSAVEETLETMKSLKQPLTEGWNGFFVDIFEGAVVFLFTAEYGLRWYSAPEDPYWKASGYVSDSACRFAYVTSFSAIIDFFAIAPFYAVLMGSDLADKYDGQLRMLRVFRLLTLDKYIPSVSLIGRIVKKRAENFKRAAYAALCLWVIFSTLLWLTERHDETEDGDALLQSERYNNVVTASPYTLVHLTGDYPLINYTIQAQLVLFVALVCAVGVVAVPTGLLASGFQSELEAFRKEEKKAKEQATTKVEKMIKTWVARWRLRKKVQAKVQLERRRSVDNMKVKQDVSLMKKISVFLNGGNLAGRTWAILMPVLGVLNVASVIVESVEPAREAIGQQALDTFELVSVLIFTVGYVLQVYAAPMSSKYDFQRRNYLFNFFGIVDLITILPWWVQTLLELLQHIGLFEGANIVNAFIFRVFRLLRLLQLEDFLSAFTLLDDAWAQCKDTMVATGFLALLVWVCGGVLFYNFENGNPNFDGDPFGSLPMSLYYTGIFLGGEWALIDFTPPGQIVCIFYCVIGIGLHGIPVGAVFEAFQNVIENVDVLDNDEEE